MPVINGTLKIVVDLAPDVKALLFHLLDIGETMDDLDTRIATLTSNVASLTTADASAEALLTGLSKELADALSSAKSAGATPEQLAAIDALNTQLSQNTGALAAAVTANTPAPAPAPAPASLSVTLDSASATAGAAESIGVSISGGTAPYTLVSPPQGVTYDATAEEIDLDATTVAFSGVLSFEDSSTPPLTGSATFTIA